MSTATATTNTVTFDPNSVSKQSDVLYPVTSRNAGLMTPAMLAQLGLAIATTDVQLYVDPVNGNDANDGSQASPLQTFQKAWSLMPVGTQKRRIFLSAGTFPITPADVNQDATFYVPPAASEGEPVSVIGTAVDSGLGSLTCTVSSANSRNIAAAPHAGDFTGAALRMTSGAAAGYRVSIESDNGTTFVLANSIEWLSQGPAVVAGDTFVVELPGSVLVPSCNIGFAGSNIGLKDLKIDCGGNFLIALTDCLIENIENVEITGAVPLGVLNNSTFSPTSLSAVFFTPSPFDTTFASGCGVYIHDGAINCRRNGLFGAAPGTDSSAVIKNCTVRVQLTSAFNMQNGGLAVIGSSFNVDERSRLTITGNSLARVVWNGSKSGKSAIAATTGSYLEFALADISNAVHDAVNADSSTQMSTGDLGGTGNGGVGLNLQSGSFAVAGNNAGASATTVTGTGGDTKVGAVTKSYASMAGTTGFAEVDATGPTMNRFTIHS